MERIGNNRLYGGVSRSPFGGNRTPQGTFNAGNMSGRKSLFGAGGVGQQAETPLKKSGQGRCSISGRSTQSIMGIRSDFHVVESYGFQLPVLVNEALTFNEKNQNVSVKCSKNGWAWVVHGRRLLIWQYKDNRYAGGQISPNRLKETSFRSTPRRASMAQCRELTLPHCDIGHKASLIKVFLMANQQMASCLAVSPTGDVRYWPSIAHDGSSIDQTGILEGQEFDQLLEVPPQQGYLLLTTTCSMVLLQMHLINGRYEMQHKMIRQPSGFLGGIGKKIASIIIGMNSGNDKENKFVTAKCEMLPDDEGAIVTVLSERCLQRWHFENNGSVDELLLDDCEVTRKIRDELHHEFGSSTTDSTDTEIHLLDMDIQKHRAFVLAGAVNAIQQFQYGLVVLSLSRDSVCILNCIPLKMTTFFSAATEQECLSYRFVLSRSSLFVYNDKVIYPMTMLTNNEGVTEHDLERKIEFHGQGDRILSAAICGNIPLFFSQTHGLVSISASDFDGNEAPSLVNQTQTSMLELSCNEQAFSLSAGADDSQLGIFELDPDAMCDFKDNVSQLKAAFVYKLKRNNAMCNTILNDLFKSIGDLQTASQGEATELDRIVIKIGKDLAEDVPAADPRWGQHWEGSSPPKHALGSSSSLQTLTQLKEKNMAMHHFIEFLHSTTIWDKLTAVPSGIGNALKPTCHILSDINEKIVGAIALKSMQGKYPKVIDEAIQRVMHMWNEIPSGNLTYQDVFYVHICKFQDIFCGLAEMLDNKVKGHQQSASLTATISDINQVVLKMLREVVSFRQQNAAIFTPPAYKMYSYEYLPWTAMSGNGGIRDTLSQLVEITMKYGTQLCKDIELKPALYQQVVDLIDFILDGRKSYLDSVRDTEKYNVLLQQFESQRRDLISVLIVDGKYDLAAKLAEKYLDFQSLVIICDETNNQSRLDHYIRQYEEYEFSQFAINWHLCQNRQGEVFERFKGYQTALSQFMRDHPSIGWIQLIFNGDFERASKILLQLAQSETEFVLRKKTMLSLAKLAAFASADSDLTSQIEKINSELYVISHQERIGQQLLEAFGFDVGNQRVLTPDEMINLLISDENVTANEYDFRQAIELLHYVEDPHELRHSIWCAVILRDNWLQYDADTATEYLQSLLFYKLIEVSQIVDGDIESFLPTLESFFSSDELEDLRGQESFQFLMKLTYEFVHKHFK